MIAPAVFSNEETVRKQCLELYNKDYEDMDRPPSVVHFQPTPDGNFEKTDCQRIVDLSLKDLGKEYKKMSAEDKKRYLDELKA